MIPGYAEALDWEARTREEAFLGHAPPIRGVPVRPLTLRRLLYLLQGQSVFLTGSHQAPDAADVALFLWVCSPDFRADDPTAQAVFIAQLAAGEHAGAVGNIVAACEEISEYLDASFGDSPAAQSDRREGGKMPITSFAAALVHPFAETYGWTVDAVLDTPLSVLYQMLRRITLSRDPKAVFISKRSMKVRGDWLRAQRARNAEDEVAAI